jgi:hypothetical protein
MALVQIPSPSAGGAADNYTLLNAGGTALTGATTVTVSGISNINSLIIVIQGASSGAASGVELRFNSDSTLKYDSIQWELVSGPSVSATRNFASNNSMDLFTNSAAGGDGSAMIFVDGCNSAGLKRMSFTGGPSGLGKARTGHYVYRGTSAISSVNIISSSTNFDAGTVFVYGA